MKEEENLKYTFGRDLLGPFFWGFCFHLDAHQAAYKDRNAVALYEARGGLRLKELYALYLTRLGRTAFLPQKEFYISRVAACKGCLLRSFDLVTPILSREFYYQTFPYMLKALVPDLRAYEDAQLLDKLPQSMRGDHITVEHIKTVFSLENDLGQKLRSYFSEQQDYFAKYIAELTAQENLLVDTGWSGTTQLILARSFPEYQWRGLYIGRWNTNGEPLPQWPYMSGLCLDQAAKTGKKIISSFFEYHHLIEAPLEPTMPSTEGYTCEENVIAPWPPIAEAQPAAQSQDDLVYAGILDYFRTCRPDLSCTEILKNKHRAMQLIAQKIHYPSQMDIMRMQVLPRSADFGRDLNVPILLPADRYLGFSQKIYRIRRALWRQGQIRQEFPILAPLFCACYNFVSARQRLNKLCGSGISSYLVYAYKRKTK